MAVEYDSHVTVNAPPGTYTSLLVISGPINAVSEIMTTLTTLLTEPSDTAIIDVLVLDENEMAESAVIFLEVACNLEPAPVLTSVTFRLEPLELVFEFAKSIYLHSKSLDVAFADASRLGSTSVLSQPTPNSIRLIASSDSSFLPFEPILINTSNIRACLGGAKLPAINLSVPVPQNLASFETELLGPSIVGTCTGDVTLSFLVKRGSYGRPVSMVWSAPFSMVVDGNLARFNADGT